MQENHGVLTTTTLEDLKQGLAATRGSIQHLTNIVLGEQERTSKIEETVKTDHASIDRLFQELSKSEKKVDQHFRLIHASRKDLRDVCNNVRELSDRLVLEQERHEDTGRQIRVAHESGHQIWRQIEALSDTTRTLAGKLEHMNGEARHDRAQLRALQSAAQPFAPFESQTSWRSARATVAQARSDPARLLEAETGIKALADQVATAAARLDALATCGEQAKIKLDLVGALHSEVSVSHTQLLADVAQTKVEAKAHLERFEGACRAIGRLESAGREFDISFRQAHDEAAEMKAGSRHQAETLSKLSSSVAALRYGLQATDAEVQDLRAYLELPPE